MHVTVFIMYDIIFSMPFENKHHCLRSRSSITTKSLSNHNFFNQIEKDVEADKERNIHS